MFQPIGLFEKMCIRDSVWGSRSRPSEVFARRRALTVEVIHKIGEAWKIPADPLVRRYQPPAMAEVPLSLIHI